MMDKLYKKSTLKKSHRINKIIYYFMKNGPGRMKNWQAASHPLKIPIILVDKKKKKVLKPLLSIYYDNRHIFFSRIAPKRRTPSIVNTSEY